MNLKLEKFIIKKFNGDQDVTINFKDNTKILIAENGSGKTTIMNIMYYALKNDVNGLKKFDFEDCIIQFSNEKLITFSKSKLDKINSKIEHRISNKYPIEKFESSIYFVETIGNISEFFFKNNGIKSFEKFLFDYFNFIKNYSANNEKNSFHSMEKEKVLVNMLIDYNMININMRLERNLRLLSDITYNDLIIINQVLNKEIIGFDAGLKFSSRMRPEVYSILRTILKYFLFDNIKDNENDKKILNGLKLMFLPTYRRIENDSIDLLSGDFSIKEGSILSFGIDDVSSLFKKITEKLNTYAKESFNTINSSALNDLISGSDEIDCSLEKWKDKNEDYFIEVLQRVGKEIKEENKLKLILIFNDNNYQDKFLLKLIKKMCEIYDRQSLIENEIIKYTEICNKYLFNKKFIYDPVKLSLQIIKFKNSADNKEIKLASLSSGEKQIISIFAKLYLSHLLSIDLDKQVNQKQDGYWIFFDEPELSLSVDWQEMLLPDIIESNRCDFLFATTHSPFIFDNNLKYHTSSINECVKDI